MRRTTTEGKAKLYETQVVALENKKTSLEVSLKTTVEQKIDIEPLKKHALTLRSKIHQMHLQMVEERLKVQQVDIRLEEIKKMASYFLDRTHDILEALQGGMTWLETNKEPPADIPIKYLGAIKLEYDLIEFSSKAAEELVKTIRRMKSACAEFYRKVLLTYKLCHTCAKRKLEEFPDNEIFLKQLQE